MKPVRLGPNATFVMDEFEPAAESSPPSSGPLPKPQRQWTWSARVGLFWASVIVPLQCVVCGLMNMSSFTRRWQSGDIRDYAEILLSRPTIPFWPLLIYSMVCLVLLLVDFNRWSARLAVRCGIYSGVLLAAQYFLVVGVALNGLSLDRISAWGATTFFAAIAVTVALVLFGGLAITPGRNRKWINVAVGVLLAGLGMTPPLFIFVLFFGAAWTTGAYLLMTWWLLRRPRTGSGQFELRQLFGVFGWVAAYCAAWRASYAWMLADYAKLPTDAPGCYIATAAARGHRRFVASQPVRTAAGQSFLANDQLRYFKAAELALICAAPGIHRAVRAAYDRLGIPLARHLRHLWMADVAYLSLKPAEWLIRALLPRTARDAA